MPRHCAGCSKTFEPRPQVPDQAYCSSPECQRARKRQWQKDKLRSDPDYQANQRAAQRAWSARNGEYWRGWRQAQQASAARDRVSSAGNDGPLLASPGNAVDPAKMDVSILPRDLYWISLRPDLPSRSESSWIVEITPVAAADRERWTRQEMT